MQLSQKRTCNKCRAYDGIFTPCELGYKIQVYWDINLFCRPLEPCYKPLTRAELKFAKC